jgi:acetyl/propionyl-CoA carboxylase alpha subunit
VRIYAEDPGANFFPAPGPVRAFVPATGRGIRWEIGLDAVDEITTRFDPMISKLVCTAGDRRQALELVAQTLERSLFAGPRNNMPFLIWLTRHPEISQRPATTHFISRYVQDALTWETVTRKALEPDEGALMGALEAGLLMESSADASLFAGNPSTDSITATAFALTPLKPTSQSLKLEIKIMNKFTAWNPVDHRSVSRYGFAVYQNGQGVSRPFQFVVHQSPNRTEHWIGLQGHNWVRVDERLSSGGSGGGTNQGDGMVAPVPGKVIQVLVNAGDAISTGQILYVLESMKMQFEVKAAKSGIAGVILVKEGDQVMSGQQLGEWA